MKPSSQIQKIKKKKGQDILPQGFTLRELDLLFIRILLLVRKHPLKLLKNGNLPRSALKKFESLFGEFSFLEQITHDLFSRFVIETLLSLGLLQKPKGQLELCYPACQDFFNLAPEPRLKCLRKNWLEAGFDFERFYLRTYYLKQVPEAEKRRSSQIFDIVMELWNPGVNEIVGARKQVLSALEELAQDEVLSFEELKRKLLKQNPDFFLPPRKVFYALRKKVENLRGVKNKEIPDNDRLCSSLQDSLLYSYLRLPLFFYAFVEHVSDAEKEIFIRPRQEKEPEPIDASRPSFIVQANHDVTVFVPETTTGVLWQLATLSSLQSANQNIFTFRIEEIRATEVFNRGFSSQNVFDFLIAHSKNDLPQNLEYSIQEWAQNAERIIIYTDAVLLEMEGVERLESLLAEPSQASIQPLGTEKWFVASSDIPLDRLPPRTCIFNYAQKLPPCLIPQADGSLIYSYEEQNFRADAALRRFAVKQSLENWEMSKASIQTAIAQGGSLQNIFKELEGLCKNPLPALLYVRLLIWGERFGKVSLSCEHLISFERVSDAELFQEIPELKSFFSKPFNLRTFLLDEQNKSELHEFLKALGLSFQENLFQEESRESLEIVQRKRAPDLPSANFSSEYFSALWQQGKSAAFEYAVEHKGSLHLLVQGAGEQRFQRVRLEAESLLQFPDKSYLEGKSLDRGGLVLFALESIMEADPL